MEARELHWMFNAGLCFPAFSGFDITDKPLFTRVDLLTDAGGRGSVMPRRADVVSEEKNILIKHLRDGKSSVIAYRLMVDAGYLVKTDGNIMGIHSFYAIASRLRADLDIGRTRFLSDKIKTLHKKGHTRLEIRKILGISQAQLNSSGRGLTYVGDELRGTVDNVQRLVNQGMTTEQIRLRLGLRRKHLRSLCQRVKFPEGTIS